MKILALGCLCAAGLGVTSVQAQDCGGRYTVQAGDSVVGIAAALYQDSTQWRAIIAANRAAFGVRLDRIAEGQELVLPCIYGLPVGLEGSDDIAEIATDAPFDTPLMAWELPEIKLLGGDDFAPFTDRTAPHGGLISDVVQSALGAAIGRDAFEMFWINDRAAHLSPMLSAGMVDIAFPWPRPDCEATPDLLACVAYGYSDPMFEYLEVLFINKAQPLAFAKDADLEGRSLCRPAGQPVDILDKNGRNWIRDDKISLITPATVAACFDLLARGKVDAVVINEFTGAAAIRALGLDDTIEAINSRPIAVSTLHAVVSNANPQAGVMLDAMNEGLAKMRETREFELLVGAHLMKYWAGL